MSTELARHLAGHGIDVPALEPLSQTGADVAVLGFPSAGDEALAWWRRLHAVAGSTGHWPLLVDPTRSVILDRSPPTGDGAAGRLARAADLDGAERLNPRGMTLDSLPDDQREELLADWPDEPIRIDGFGLPYTRT